MVQAFPHTPPRRERVRSSPSDKHSHRLSKALLSLTKAIIRLGRQAQLVDDVIHCQVGEEPKSIPPMPGSGRVDRRRWCGICDRGRRCSMCHRKRGCGIGDHRRCVRGGGHDRQLTDNGYTLSQNESYAPSGMKLPPPHDIATQTPPLHVGIADSMQSVDADHMIATAAVATMVLPVKGIVQDITVGSSYSCSCRCRFLAWTLPWLNDQRPRNLSEWCSLQSRPRIGIAQDS